MSNFARRFGVLAAALFVSIAFQNCADPADIEAPPVQHQTANLKLLVPSATVTAGSQLQLIIKGGEEPYSFYVASGGGSISPTSGLFTAGAAASSVTIGVMDANGEYQEAGIEVVRKPGSTSTGGGTDALKASCTTPWGETIAHGQNVRAYQSESVACRQTCQSELRACNDGKLSGTFTKMNCGAQACEKTFDLFSAKACTNGYCSCRPGKKQNSCSTEDATAICKVKGFKKAKAVNCAQGPKNAKHCDANGKNCFVNKDVDNFVCNVVQCER